MSVLKTGFARIDITPPLGITLAGYFHTRLPDEKELILTAVAVGDMVFAGLPGEPFTDVGQGIKEGSRFTLTMPTCCSNGYKGYFPMQSAYEEGGCEARTARYDAGTAEKRIEVSPELVNGL